MQAVERRFGSLDASGLSAAFGDAGKTFSERSDAMLGLIYELMGGSQSRPTMEDLGQLLDITDIPVVAEAVGELMGGGGVAGDPRSLAPFVPTPAALVERMLDAAGLAPGEVLIDPCCGDGRVLAAACARGARAVGYELDSRRAVLARESVSKMAAEVHEGDGALAEFGTADVIFLYTLPASNGKLQPSLIAQCKPTCRVVSHAFDMPGWVPYQTGVVDGGRFFAWKISDVRPAECAAAA
jgi:hypothetical protein